MQISEAQREKNVKGTKGNKRQMIPACVYGKAATTSAGFAVGDPGRHLSVVHPCHVCAGAVNHIREKLLNGDLVEKLNEPEVRETD